MIVVEHVAGLATVQDLGRPGRMHEGLAPGGALVPEMLIAANRAVGNLDPAPAIELLGRIRLRVETPVALAFGAQLVESAGELQIESGALRVIYVAVRGGFAAPEVCGGRGTQLSAGIGAPLRAGDRLRIESARGSVPASPVPFVVDDAPIHVIPGPDSLPGALAALLAGDFQISPISDRVGTRLDGPSLPAPAGHGSSRPMTRGAIELPPDGHPIVLGPEHPVTGGYPVIAVVATVDQGRLFARPIRARVQFKQTSGAAR